jgi:L-threonylcarbamoyladenylate synthase
LKTTNKIEVAAQWVLEKRIIAYPTEGIWGLGGLNLPKVIKGIDKIKSRPANKKYILLFHSSKALSQRFSVEAKYIELIEKHTNTFTTMIIPTSKGKIAARIPKPGNLLSFLQLIEKPLISTSANTSGEEVCKNINEIKAVFDDKIHGALDLALGGENESSKILDLETNEYIR